ncbi:MAG: o-succinylbenzoate synthase [candidate division Zixibacteria bacterium]|nr:o-succinylbenzoate synthase [candidate division Zixibacteria bacterium]
MSNLSLSAIPYVRLLQQAIVTAHGSYHERRGLILILRDGDGRCGLGDTSPLLGFSRETLDDVPCGLEGIRRELSRGNADIVPDSIDDVLQQEDRQPGHARLPPSLRFAWDTARCDLAARRQGIPLAGWLCPDAARTVPVNALLSDSSPSALTRKAVEYLRQGFTTFKIKVGVGSVANDVARVRAVRDAVPDAALRFDANGGWDENQLEEALNGLCDLRLEFIEQPLGVGRSGESRRICRDHGVALALDEDAGNPKQALDLIEAGACDVLVVKPMMMGGIGACLTIARQAKDHGIRIVYTSLWESDVGLAATLHLAAALGSDPPACGLSTAGMIAEGLVDQPLRIEAGHLVIRRLPGLGMNLSDELLAEMSGPR